ncbi:MAG: hypothetical protein R3211_00015 [Balneolaceae bacterium]|nr:hypothetical protein [Balneolaceae bacterium]
MKWKTKFIRWLPWIVSFAVAAILLLFLGIWPYEIADRVSVLESINMFSSGTPTMRPYWNDRILSLVGIVLFFVVGPVLWFSSEDSRPDRSGELSNGFQPKSLMWYLGAILTLTGLLFGVAGTAFQLFHQTNIEQSVQRSRNADHLRQEISTLGLQAAELFLLPHDRGGGNGSFTRIPNGNGSFHPITLEDLEAYQPEQLNAGTYHLDEVTDSTILIYGVGTHDGKEPDFKNINGETGRNQVVVLIEPFDKIMRFQSQLRN